MIILDHPVWDALRLNAAKHVEVIIGTGELIVIAGIVTMPKLYPKTFQDAWSWIRDWAQTAVPANRFRHEESSSSTVETPTNTTKKESSMSESKKEG